MSCDVDKKFKITSIVMHGTMLEVIINKLDGEPDESDLANAKATLSGYRVKLLVYNGCKVLIAFKVFKKDAIEVKKSFDNTKSICEYWLDYTNDTIVNHSSNQFSVGMNPKQLKIDIYM